MKSDEHRAVGEAATTGALVQLGGDCAEERLVLSYSDVIALSGDFFTCHRPGTHGVERTQVEPEDLTSDDLFRLAAIPGKRGTEPGTRDEIICALKVMATGPSSTPASTPEGSSATSGSPRLRRQPKVERRVRDRFLTLATVNGDHFVAPGRPDTAPDHTGPQPTRFASAVLAYRVLYNRAHAAVKARTSGFPPLTLGDLLARVFHDWDNSHGLTLQEGRILFGDGLLEQGVGKDLAVAAVRAGIDDVEVAYRLGASSLRPAPAVARPNRSSCRYSPSWHTRPRTTRRLSRSQPSGPRLCTR